MEGSQSLLQKSATRIVAALLKGQLVLKREREREIER